MRVTFLTLALDSMPWITFHYPEFQKLMFDWKWHVVEGVAASANCTSWCKQQTPRLSNDGTTQYLDSIAAYDPRICLHRKELWNGKVAMCNAPLRLMHEPCLLVEIDSDELWTASQLQTLVKLFIDNPDKNCAYFYCDYRLGPNIRITSRNTYGNNTAYEWHRAWRWRPLQFFKTHEPPKFEHLIENPISHEETAAAGLVFRHEAYSTERQVAWKQEYYGSPNNEKGHLYAGAVAKWKKLQDNRHWPVRELSQYLPWVGSGVVADLI